MTLSLLLLLVIAALVMSFQCWAWSQKCSKQHVLIYRSIKPCWPGAALPNQASCSLHLPWETEMLHFLCSWNPSAALGRGRNPWSHPIPGLWCFSTRCPSSQGTLAQQLRPRPLSLGLQPCRYMVTNCTLRLQNKQPLCWEKCIFIYGALSSCSTLWSWNRAGRILVGCSWDWVYAARAGGF